MEKTWFMAPMEHNPNEKDIMAPMEYTFMVYKLNEKSMVSWFYGFIFWSGNHHGKR